MTKSDFFSEIIPKHAISQPDPPCEKYWCKHIKKCKSELLACGAFHYYVVTGTVFPPNKTIRDEKRGWHIKTKVPTRERYMMIFGDY